MQDGPARGARAAGGARPEHLAYVHLHLGLDRPAQGRRRTRTRRSCNRLLWMQRAYRLDAGRPGAAEDAVQLRRLGVGALLAAADRRAPGARAARRRTATRRYLRAADRASRASPRCTSCRRCCRRSWRRADVGSAARACGAVICSGEALPRRAGGSAFLARLPGAGCTTSTARPRRRSTSRHWACRRGGRPRAVPIGRPIANTRLLRARPATCSRCRSAWPASCYIGGVGLARGYLRPAGPDRRALRARPVRGAGGRAVPHRRPGALAAGRDARVSWAASTTR